MKVDLRLVGLFAVAVAFALLLAVFLNHYKFGKIRIEQERAHFSVVIHDLAESIEHGNGNLVFGVDLRNTFATHIGGIAVESAGGAVDRQLTELLARQVGEALVVFGLGLGLGVLLLRRVMSRSLSLHQAVTTGDGTSVADLADAYSAFEQRFSETRSTLERLQRSLGAARGPT